jgi:hypothetical protein
LYRIFTQDVAMKIFNSLQFRPESKDTSVEAALRDIAPAELRRSVEQLSFPRNYCAERAENARAGQLIFDRFESLGYKSAFVGQYRNVFAYTDACAKGRVVLVCAHYDSVPGCPAADDNGSAVAGQLALAELTRNHFSDLPIAFVAVNREEDGLLGSREFAEIVIRERPIEIAEVHNLEMIGFSSSRPGSQTLPSGLVVPGVDAGDFLALVGNTESSDAIREVIIAGRTYVPELPIVGLQVDDVFARQHPDLLRSDHASFWERGLKQAIQYTDTANFRNPNYHRTSDTPDTLNYEFLGQVTATVFATIIKRAQQLNYA